MTDSLSLALADCLNALSRGDTLDQCLARYPEQRAELTELLLTAQQLHSAPNSAPSSEFRRVARARLINRLAPRGRLNGLAPVTFADSVRSTWQTLTQSFRRPAMRWIAILLITTSLFGGVTAAYASNDALPGDGLYSVKRALESARLAAAFSSADAAELRVRFAARRLAEAQALVQLGRASETDELFRSYAAELNGLSAVWARVSATERQQLQADLAWQAQTLAGFDLPSAHWAREAMTALTTSNDAPIGWATPLPSPTATPSPSQIKPTVRATSIVTASPTDWATYAPNYCWPADLPTPTQWPNGWPTPRANCTPAPVPSHLPCWPADWPTPNPTQWPSGWPTPAATCEPRPTGDWTQLATHLPTNWVTPDPSQWATYVPTQFATYLPPALPTLVIRTPGVSTSPSIPTVVLPTHVVPTAQAIATQLATQWPTSWPTPNPSQWPPP